jgi:hypothetical protein
MPFVKTCAHLWPRSDFVVENIVSVKNLVFSVGKRKWDCRVRYRRSTGCKTLLTPFCVVVNSVWCAVSKPVPQRLARISLVITGPLSREDTASICRSSSDVIQTESSGLSSNPSPFIANDSTLANGSNQARHKVILIRELNRVLKA